MISVYPVCPRAAGPGAAGDISLRLPVPGDIAGPPGDIPGWAGTFPKKVGNIAAIPISRTPRRGYPRPPGTSPGRVGDIPGRPGISPAARRGCPRRAGTSPALRGYPRPRRGCPRRAGTSPARGGGHPRPARGYHRPFGGCPARVLVCRTAHCTHSSPPTHAIKNETRQGVNRCLCDPTRPSESSCCAAVAAARAALVPGGEARTSEPHSEARRGEASGGQSRPQTTVCAAVWRALRPSRGVAEARTARGARAAGGRRAGEPAAREGAWPRRAQARSRGQALWSLGAARGGARPREHTQLSGAAVARRSGARLSGPEESPRAPDPPLGVERRWSLGGQHEHLPGADRASRRHVG